MDKTLRKHGGMGTDDASVRVSACAEARAVRAARRLVHEEDADAVRLMTEITAIPAPTGEEHVRAAFMAGLLGAAGLEVRQDGAGNVIAGRAGQDAADAVLLVAHLDTVFAADADVAVRSNGGRLSAPGISDNGRGLAALAIIARVLHEAGVATRRPVIFVCSVGEEGRGDLRGVKHLFREGSPFRAVSAVIALDGAGDQRIVNRGVGSRRFRIAIDGPGGHSWADYGRANPIHAMASCTTQLLALPLSRNPRSTLTVARTAGGTSINAIPEQAWVEVDTRSESEATLATLEQGVRAAAARAVRDANAHRRRGTASLRLEITPIGARPAGDTPAGHILVRVAQAATRLLGRDPELAASSTDANLPMSIGIPAIAIGCGGTAAGMHSVHEWYENEAGALGIERALLVALAAAEVES